MTIYPPHLCEQRKVWATKTQNPHFLCPYCPQTHNLHAGPQALPLHAQASGGTFRILDILATLGYGGAQFGTASFRDW